MRWSKDQIRQWWLFSRVVDWAPAVIALIGYGLLRIGITGAVVYRDGWPTSALGWIGAVSSVAAAGQAGAVAVLLPAARRRRPVLAAITAAAGIGTALVDASMWVTFGGAAATAGYAWSLVLAVVFAIAAMVVCRTGIASIWSRSGYNLQRITRALFWLGGVAAAVAAAGGVAALMVEQPAAVDRLLRLAAVAGLASTVIATIVLIPVAGEQLRTNRQAEIDEFYELLSDARDSTDR